MKIEKLKAGDRVEITWDDATGDSGWVGVKEVKWPKMRCRTLGFFIQANELAVMLADSLFEDWEEADGTIGGVTTIPRGMVIRVRKVRP